MKRLRISSRQTHRSCLLVHLSARASLRKLFLLNDTFNDVKIIKCGGRSISAKLVLILVTLALICAPAFGPPAHTFALQKSVDNKILMAEIKASDSWICLDAQMNECINRSHIDTYADTSD